MRNLLLFIASTAILLALASCSNHDNKARGRKLGFSLYGGYMAFTGTEFLDINPMAKVGDTLRIDGDLYVIDTIVVRK